MNHEQERGDRDERHRREVALEVVRELRAKRRDHRIRGGHREQRVAVGRRLRDTFGRDRAARAGTVLHDHLLPEHLTHFRCEEPRGDIRDTAGREADEHANGLDGIRLCECESRRDERSNARRDPGEITTSHSLSPSRARRSGSS
jgi:hypothetical protein